MNCRMEAKLNKQNRPDRINERNRRKLTYKLESQGDAIIVFKKLSGMIKQFPNFKIQQWN